MHFIEDLFRIYLFSIYLHNLPKKKKKKEMAFQIAFASGQKGLKRTEITCEKFTEEVLEARTEYVMTIEKGISRKRKKKK